ncbi:hypothetical protein LUZ61_009876 [Rhynchospora tenuis]|uniref:Uncharacterized protein n=1 Tax=Rhynchospora tenuis TaxID=198213 RepID=A0AAD5ZY15_9POAL|nr:hypothetical protein LUZ61_009876 [Rhynchospora tenuis]
MQMQVDTTKISPKGKEKVKKSEGSLSSIKQFSASTYAARTKKIHGFSQPRAWEKRQMVSIGKNKMPVSDDCPIFQNDFSAKLSLKSSALLDANFVAIDKAEKAKALHVLANQLYSLEQDNKKIKEKIRDISTSKQKIEERVRHHQNPIHTLERSFLIPKLRNNLLGELPNEISHKIKHMCWQQYDAMLQELYHIAHRARVMQIGVVIRKMKIYEDEYYKWTPEEISNLYAHGFIHTIDFTHSLPEGLPKKVSDLINYYRFEENTVVHIARTIPRWDPSSMKRKDNRPVLRSDGQTTINVPLKTFIGITNLDLFQSENSRYRPVTTLDMYLDSSLSYLTLEDSDEEVYRDQATVVQLCDNLRCFEDEDLMVGNDGTEYYDSDLEDAIANRLEA